MIQPNPLTNDETTELFLKLESAQRKIADTANKWPRDIMYETIYDMWAGCYQIIYGLTTTPGGLHSILAASQRRDEIDWRFRP